MKLGRGGRRPLSYKKMEIERKQMERALQESGERYRAFFQTSRDCVFITSREGRWIDFNDAAVELFGYASREELASVSIPNLYESPQDREEHLRFIEGRGFSKDYPLNLRKKDGTVISALVTSIPVRGTDGTVVGYQGTIRDITAGKRAEEEVKRSYARLQKLLEELVDVLASTVEIRDPYTAGHQRRVTQLACAIAEEMGLSREQIAGIRMAGLVHDLGKINVPAEILSKPGRLTEIELSMIKAHPQMGYNILKTIELPWPVAQIVLQHHERLDGSGYPAGLVGEEILLEARILGVADVVEAMASHRPYRPGHGLEEALEEIAKDKGALYDARVVDACLLLFKKEGFAFGSERGEAWSPRASLGARRRSFSKSSPR
jgi:PAS domain S-box-containing protein/putative nucleotidyltransferase with HDIG domain